MPFSEVQLANMALARLGQSERFPEGDGTVAGIDTDDPDLTVHAEQVQLWWTTVRDNVGRDFCWGAQTKYAELALASDGDDEVWETVWENAWVYPSDCLFLRGFVSIAGLPWPLTDWPASWSMALATGVRWGIGTHGGTKVVFANGVDEDAPLVEYTVRLDDADDFDVDVGSALSWRLAAELASTLVRGEEGANMRVFCQQQYALAVSSAQKNDANESGPLDNPDGRWISARSG